MKVICLLTLFVLLSGSLNAQSSLPDKPGTMLWKITAPSGKVSHILGTTGVNADTIVYYGIPDWENMVKSARYVITTWEELAPVEKVEDIRLDVVRYTDLFTPQQLALLDSMMPRYNFSKPGMTAAYFPLIMVAEHIKVRLMMEMNPIACFGENHMEEIICRMAKYSKIPIVALDSGMAVKRPDFVVYGGNPHDYNHNRQMATSIIDLIQAAIPASKYRPASSEYWPRQVKYHFNDTVAYTAIPALKHVLTERNEYWMPKLSRYLADTECFVILGIDHLKFKDGILNQLVAKGFDVSPVAMNVK